MQKEEGYNISETGNWNVASDFSRIKVMKPLDYIDHYENIAKFGYDTMLEEIQNYGVPLDELKLMGFNRLLSEMLKLCSNVRFAMKRGKTREELEKIEKRLKGIKALIPQLYKTISKKNRRYLVLKEKEYFIVLDKVLELKSELNEPLNKNHLIFTDREEFDPKAYKKQIMDNAKNLG